MIIGYYSVEYKGNLKIKDYLGCIYPEGMLLPEQACTFNHSDIEFIDFIGYKNDELKSFMSNFDELTGNSNSLEQEALEFHKNNDMVLTSSKAYSKLLFDEDGIVMIAEPAVEEKKDIGKKDSYQFDENGYVISVNKTETTENPFYKIYENKDDEEVTSEASSWDIFNKVPVEKSEEDLNDQKDKLLNKIEFDENGSVVAVYPRQENIVEKEDLKSTGDASSQKKSQYIFDENGIVISVN